MFVNSVPFLVTISRRIRLRTSEYLPSRTRPILGHSLKKVLNVYTRGVFMVNVILMDQEFDKVAPDMDLALVNTTAAREHVAEVEREIRTIKEGTRSTVSTL